MTDAAILSALGKRQKELERIASCEAGIKKAKAQILEINRFIAQWEKFSGLKADDVEVPNPLKGAVNSPRQVQNPTKEQITELVENILSKSQNPMTRSDIYNELHKQNVVLNGTNPEMILSTMLWRTKESSNIERIKGGGYRLRPIEKTDAALEETDWGDEEPN